MFLGSNYKILAGIAIILLPLLFIFLFLPSKLSQQALGQQQTELQSLGNLLHQTIEDDLHAYGRFVTSLAMHPEIVATAENSPVHTASRTNKSAHASDQHGRQPSNNYQQADQSLIDLFGSFRALEPHLDTLLLVNSYGRPWLELAKRKGIKPPSLASFFSETSTGFHISTNTGGRATGLWVAAKIDRSSNAAQANYVLLRFNPKALRSAAWAASSSISDRAVYIRTSKATAPSTSIYSAVSGQMENPSLKRIDEYLQTSQQLSGPDSTSHIWNDKESSTPKDTNQLTYIRPLNPIAGDLLIFDSWNKTAGSINLSPSESIRTILLTAVLMACASAIVLVATVIRSNHTRLTRIFESISRILKRDYDHSIGDSTSDLMGRISRQLDSLSKDYCEEFSVGLAIHETVQFKQFHDQITQLPNRESVLNYLSDLENSKQTEGLTLFMFELSDIDCIRQTHSDAAVVHVFQTISQRIHEKLPVATMVGQWNEGSFVVLQQNDNDRLFTRNLPALMQFLAADIRYKEDVIQLNFNHGIAHASKATTTPKLIAEASSMISDQNKMRSRDSTRMLESANIVEETVASSRLSVVYQPVMLLDKNESLSMAQAEVTVRLHKDNGEIHPTSNLLNDIQDHTSGLKLDSEVIVSALSEMMDWHQKNLLREDFRLSFNLTRFTLKTQAILKLLRNQVIERGVKPEHLIFEISAMSLLQNSDTLNAIRSMGIRIAVDDIATEELSISQLQTMRPDFMKMDINNLERAVTNSDRMAKAQLRTRLAYFRSLGISIIAKNIESSAQHELAKEFGLKLIQGHLVARPSDGQQFMAAWGEQQSINKAA